MRRLLTRSALCLTLGLLTTIAIAWWSAARPISANFARTILPNGADISRLDTAMATTLQVSPPLGLSNEASGPSPADNTASALIPAWARPVIAPALATPRPLGVVRVIELRADGWPFRAAYYQRTLQETLDARFAPVITGGFALPDSFITRLIVPHPYGKTLPSQPIWSGLLADAALFAVVWFFLLSTPAVLRTHYRRRRNLCPRCAYSLLNLPPNSPCPECGHTTAAPS